MTLAGGPAGRAAEKGREDPFATGRGWGYAPSGVIGIVLIVLLVLLLAGRI
ncbi:MAG: DUF3309 family protein [Thioalkalivibrio sp.]|nr:MAG: DUF3309 family protein [Thioalkalivibrio sp.]